MGSRAIGLHLSSICLEDDGYPPWTFTIGFYALPFGQSTSFAASEGTFAAINFLTWIPLMLLIASLPLSR